MDKLRKNRSVVRGATTRRLSSATDLLKQEIPSTEELQVALDDLLDKDATLAGLNEKIAHLVYDDSYEEEVSTALDYHERILSCISRIRLHTRSRSDAILAQAAATVSLQDTPGDRTEYVMSGAAPTAPTVHDNPALVMVPRPSTKRVALPKLQVPVFSGDLRERHGFWEHFEATIHTNPDLPAIEKFKYLRSYLTGQAKRAVEWIRLTEDNYATAVNVLTQRFGRTDTLVDEHIDSLLAITPIQNSSQLARLRQLYEHILFRTSCLETLGVSPAEYAVVLHRVLMRSLPEDIPVLYRQRMKEDVAATEAAASRAATDAAASREPAASRAAQVKNIMEFLQVRVESREDTRAGRARLASTVPGTMDSSSQAPVASSTLPTALALAASSSHPRPSCPLCNLASHTVQECHVAISTDDKRRRLTAKNCCFKCGKHGHFARSCRSATWLRCRHCSRRHLSVLCDLWKRNDDAATDQIPTPGSVLNASAGDEQPVTSAPASSDSPSPTLLQTATVWAAGGNERIKVRVLFDTGSQRTFIRRDISLKLGLPCIDEEDLTVYTFGNSARPQRYHCRKVRVELRSLFGDKSVALDALEVPEVCTVRSADITPELRSSLHTKEMQLAHEPSLSGGSDSVISVLIGSDLYWTVVTGCVDRLSEHMCAVETVFGWTVQGAYSQITHPLSANGHTTALFLACSEGWCTAHPAGDPSEMWRLDAIGITDPGEPPREEPTAVVQFRDAVYKDKGRYVVPIMLRSQGHVPSTNRTVAETRLMRQLQHFLTQPEVLQEYDSVIREYPKEGHAEVVPANDDSRMVYYLPHHAVVRREAVTTKVRVVFDASSHELGSPSLNDVLDKGVKLGAELFQLLLQFRCSPIVLTADIRKAFMQVCIRPDERDLLRFLWFNQLPTEGLPTPSICEWRMTRVPFGAPSSPFLLAATLQHHLEEWKKTYPNIAARLQKSFYVDDLVIGAHSQAEALDIYRTASAILADASMELRKWCSSSSVLNERFYADGVSIDNVTGRTTSCKVLGLVCDGDADIVVVSTQNVSSYVATPLPTKRTVLQAFARIYDPLGLIAPFVLRAKLLFQNLLKLHKGWDDPLERETKAQWTAWTSEQGFLSSVRVPRCVVPAQSEEGANVELHMFCDASPLAYGTVVYVRYALSNGQYSVRLLMSKCRVAPVKPVSLPRLELLACLLAARLWDYVRQVPEFSSYMAWFWTASAIALQWITGGNDRQETFVRNRSSEIRRLTETSTWQHCRSHDNPADLITRGAPASFAQQKLAWWSGPSWLSRPEPNWPPRAATPKTDNGSNAHLTACPTVPVPSPSPEPLLQVTHYERLLRLLRITAWIKRFL
ncbi:uncharacterized protein LOC135389409 [Ornithodoros turicata]|uniref:uncharacterized protein LOC135389409 n=1 Tax=Ornithodoros turicata TaxID=34597 RepID=UPI003139CD52